MSSSETPLSNVLYVCNRWIAKGRGDECFWEDWTECPTEEELTPKMVLAAIEELEAKATKANQ